MSFAFAQSSFQAGLMPSINFNKGISEDWSLNFKIESRQLFKEGFFRNENEFNYDYLLTDFTTITSKKIGLNNAISIGYTARFVDKDLGHRFIQQFTLTKRYTSLRLAHRFSTDQTFAKERSIQFRVRYRLTTELPLNGQSVDPKEFYIKINNEYLNVFQNKDYDLELRLVPLLGYNFNDNNKLECGLDYRLSSFLNADSRSSFWLSINWFIKIE
jgi:hypothetical protein